MTLPDTQTGTSKVESGRNAVVETASVETGSGGHDEMLSRCVIGCLGPCQPVKCRGALVRGIQSCMHFIMSGMMLFWLKFDYSYCEQLANVVVKILLLLLLLLLLQWLVSCPWCTGCCFISLLLIELSVGALDQTGGCSGKAYCFATRRKHKSGPGPAG